MNQQDFTNEQDTRNTPLRGRGRSRGRGGYRGRGRGENPMSRGRAQNGRGIGRRQPPQNDPQSQEVQPAPMFQQNKEEEKKETWKPQKMQLKTQQGEKGFSRNTAMAAKINNFPILNGQQAIPTFKSVEFIERSKTILDNMTVGNFTSDLVASISHYDMQRYHDLFSQIQKSKLQKIFNQSDFPQKRTEVIVDGSAHLIAQAIILMNTMNTTQKNNFKFLVLLQQKLTLSKIGHEFAKHFGQFHSEEGWHLIGNIRSQIRRLIYMSIAMYEQIPRPIRNILTNENYIDQGIPINNLHGAVFPQQEPQEVDVLIHLRLKKLWNQLPKTIVKPEGAIQMPEAYRTFSRPDFDSAAIDPRYDGLINGDPAREDLRDYMRNLHQGQPLPNIGDIQMFNVNIDDSLTLQRINHIITFINTVNSENVAAKFQVVQLSLTEQSKFNGRWQLVSYDQESKTMKGHAILTVPEANLADNFKIVTDVDYRTNLTYRPQKQTQDLFEQSFKNIIKQSSKNL